MKERKKQYKDEVQGHILHPYRPLHIEMLHNINILLYCVNYHNIVNQSLHFYIGKILFDKYNFLKPVSY